MFDPRKRHPTWHLGRGFELTDGDGLPGRPLSLDALEAHLDQIRQVDPNEADRLRSELTLLVRIKALVEAAGSDPSLRSLADFD